MNNTRRNFHKIMLTTAALWSIGALSLPGYAATAEDLKQDAAQALQTLYKAHPEAQQLSKSARAVLVFPKIPGPIQGLGVRRRPDPGGRQ